MRRFRRPLVWLPLVALTLFFAACGWHNRQIFLEDEDNLNEDVVLAAFDYALPTFPRNATIYVEGGGWSPSSRLENLIRQHHPKTRILSESEPRPPKTAHIHIDLLDRESRYTAGCYLTWNTGTMNYTPQGLGISRSPFNWGSSWHVTGAVLQDSDLWKLP